MSDIYPDELLDDVGWSFTGGHFSSLTDFNNAVRDYGDYEENSEWRSELIVLNVSKVKIILFNDIDYYSSESSSEILLEVILWADNDKSFTAGELFFKVHNAFVDRLESLKYKDFLYLCYLDDFNSETSLPAYRLVLCSEEYYEAASNDNSGCDLLYESVKIKDSHQVKLPIDCPSCHSHDWKLASFIYKAGLTHVNTSSNSVGVGVSSGIGVGVSYSDTVGQHQTELSRLAAPPVKQSINRKLSFFEAIAEVTPAIVMFLCFGYFYLNSDETFWDAMVAGLKTMGISLVFYIIFDMVYGDKQSDWYRKEEDSYRQEHERWQKKKICMRCGTSFY